MYISQAETSLNEGRRQKAGGRRISTPREAWQAFEKGFGRYPALWGILTRQQLLTAKSKILAGALNPKVPKDLSAWRVKDGLNLLPSALELLPSKASALVTLVSQISLSPNISVVALALTSIFHGSKP